MSVGVLIGLRWFPARLQTLNSRLQLICIAVLIFAMGVSLGNRPNFLDDLQSLGWHSFLLAIFPMLFSTLFVYILSRLTLVKGASRDGLDEKGRKR